MSKFPSSKKIRGVSKKLRKGLASHPLAASASAVDRAKHKLCSYFILYVEENKLSQKEFAKLLDIDEALVSKILHYQIQSFTTDRLIRYLSTIHPDFEVEFKIA